jgi:cupin superfamily acireductone dioxygenase involved in methionine salvage
MDHLTDSAASTEVFRRREKAIGYTDASSYVHCTQPGLNSYSYKWKEPIITKKSKSDQANTAFKTCMVIHVHLRAVIRYCLFGLGLASAEQLKDRQHPATDIMSTEEQAS